MSASRVTQKTAEKRPFHSMVLIVTITGASTSCHMCNKNMGLRFDAWIIAQFLFLKFNFNEII